MNKNSSVENQPMYKVKTPVKVDVLDRNVKSGAISTDDKFIINDVIQRNGDIFYRLKDIETDEFHIIHQDHIIA